MYCVTTCSVAFQYVFSPAEGLSVELLHWNDVMLWLVAHAHLNEQLVKEWSFSDPFFFMLIYQICAFISTCIIKLKIFILEANQKSLFWSWTQNYFCSFYYMCCKNPYIWSAYSLTICNSFTMWYWKIRVPAAVCLQTADQAAELTVLQMSCCLCWMLLREQRELSVILTSHPQTVSHCIGHKPWNQTNGRIYIYF